MKYLKMKIHEWFERRCSRYVGWAIHTRYKGPDPFWFKYFSRIEFWLRPKNPNGGDSNGIST